MKVAFYYGSNLMLSRDMTSVPRINDRVVIDINGEPRVRTVHRVEWRPEEDVVNIICEKEQSS